MKYINVYFSDVSELIKLTVIHEYSICEERKGADAHLKMFYFFIYVYVSVFICQLCVGACGDYKVSLNSLE